MSAFLLAAAALVVLLLGVFIWPIWRAKRFAVGEVTPSNQRSAENLGLYHEHVAELDRELSQQRIDNSQYQRLVAELQRNFLADQDRLAERPLNRRGSLVLIVSVIVLVVVSGWLYISRGATGDVLFAQMQQQLERDHYAQRQAGQAPDAQATRELVAAIEARLVNQPDNAQYWYLLGRYASQIGDYKAAQRGFRQVYQRSPSEPGNASALAQAIFLSNGNQLTEEVSFLTERALEVDPKDTTALGLAGINAFEQQDFAAAARHWGRAIKLTPEGTAGRQALMSGVARALKEAKARGQDLAAGSHTSAKSEGEPHNWSVRVQLSVAADLSVPADATLFVYARAYQGSPMPLVVTRLPVGQFPATITLNETMAMTSTDRLLSGGPIELVARISQSGQVSAQAGDLQGLLGPLDMAELPDPVQLSIDTQL
jgi:cytochrome c-type biogenesis protein CcmH